MHSKIMGEKIIEIEMEKYHLFAILIVLYQALHLNSIPSWNC